jgi:hypothetical protein
LGLAVGGARLRVEGADALALDGDVLRLTTPLGEYKLPLLQVVGAADANLASPTITGDQVALPFASAIPNPQLVLSPVEVSAIANPQSGASDLLYSTFLGGSGNDWGNDIAVDGAGSAYVTGETRSSDFSTTAGAFDRSHNGSGDAFVVKMNAAGTGLAYATFLGGSSGERSYGIAVDGAGSAHVTGRTESSNFPTTAEAFDRSHNGDRDAFVVKVNAGGTELVYATFLGGSGGDSSFGIVVDGAGSAHVTGRTYSSNFPTTAEAFDRNHNGDRDAFVVKVSAGGTELVYATFLGGSGGDGGRGIVVDGAGSAYVTGYTKSFDFPTTAGAFDTSYNGGDDTFAVKVNAGGTGLAYATFLGGSGEDEGDAIVVDGAGSAYVTGLTFSSDFPTTAGAFDTSYGGGDCPEEPCHDAFVVKVNAGGTDLVYATFLGGSDEEEGRGIVVDGAGSAYVTGNTSSSDFPTTAGAFDTSYNGNGDAFVANLTFQVVGTVTPSGGSLASPADRTTYTFAAGTFTDTVTITHIPLPFSNVPSAGNLVDIGRAFSVTAVYSDTGQPAQLTQPYTITVQYTEAEKGPSIENTLALYCWDSSQWAKELSSGVDTISNTVTATPDHFSPWAVLGETLRTFLPIILKSY